LSVLDLDTYSLASMDWLNRDTSMPEKFSDLLESISKITAQVSTETTLRAYSYFMLFFMLLRVIIYMNCHPRIAVLYGTIMACLDDLMHFVIIASVIYSVFAYSAYWMIGSENDKFETLTDALWSQFEMIIGEFPFAEGRVASFFEMFYMFSYAMLVFVLLINSFLLAVVVGAYEQVKTAINECLVEQTVFYDAYQAFYYPLWKQRLNGWPEREDVAIALAGYDANDDGKADAADARISVSVNDLMKLKDVDDNVLFKSPDSAKKWMRHFTDATPILKFGYAEPDVPLLMHQLVKEKLSRLALLSSKGPIDMSMLDQETDQEKAQKAAEEAVKAMTELAELIPMIQLQPKGPTSPGRDGVNPNVAAGHGGTNGSAAEHVKPEYLEASEKLSAQISALTDSLAKQYGPNGEPPLSIANGVNGTPATGPVPAKGGAIVSADGGELTGRITRLEDKLERILANQEFVRSYLTGQGAARPVFSPRDRVAGPDGMPGHGPGAHRALGPGPGPRGDEGDSSARFLAECLHPELETDEQTVHINDRHMREVDYRR